MRRMFSYNGIEALFAKSTPPRAGSTEWYDACDLLATAVKGRLRERFKRGFHVEVYGDEVGLILRIRGDGYGVEPWSCLLYTSPSPRDLSTSRMPSSA